MYKIICHVSNLENKKKCAVKLTYKCPLLTPYFWWNKKGFTVSLKDDNLDEAIPYQDIGELIV